MKLVSAPRLRRAAEMSEMSALVAAIFAEATGGAGAAPREVWRSTQRRNQMSERKTLSPGQGYFPEDFACSTTVFSEDTESTVLSCNGRIRSAFAIGLALPSCRKPPQHRQRKGWTNTRSLQADVITVLHHGKVLRKIDCQPPQPQIMTHEQCFLESTNGRTQWK